MGSASEYCESTAPHDGAIVGPLDREDVIEVDHDFLLRSGCEPRANRPRCHVNTFHAERHRKQGLNVRLTPILQSTAQTRHR